MRLRHLTLLAACACVACAEPGARRDLGGDGQAPTEAGPTEAGPNGCGNGRVEGSESFDGTSLGGQTCAKLGLGFGELRCTSSCRFDLSGCSSCGDGKVQGAEACDGSDLGGATCGSLGFLGGGTLACSKTCQHDTSGCVAHRAGHATLVYATTSALRELRLDTATGAWSSATALPAISDAPAWVVNRISPKGEELVATSTGGTAVMLHVLRQPAGGSWTLDQSTALNIPTSEAGKRPFDLIHEASSGEALLVYSDNGPNPQYRTLAGGVWSPPKAVFATPPGSSPVRWVVLASRPGTDELALAFADAHPHLYVVIWDGAAFRTAQAERLTEDDPTHGYPGMGFDTQCFDLAYETSGEMLVAHGEACCSCLPTALKGPADKTLSGGPDACAASGRILRLVPQPAGDAIAAVGDFAGAGAWDGGSWSQARWYWPGPGAQPGDPPRWTDAAWVGTRPVAVVVHRGWPEDPGVSGGTGQLHWLRSLPGGTWQNGAPFKVASLGELVWPQLRTFPAEERVLAVFSDDKRGLRAASYDLINGWSLLGSNPLAADLALTPKGDLAPRPFSVDIIQK